MRWATEIKVNSNYRQGNIGSGCSAGREHLGRSSVVICPRRRRKGEALAYWNCLRELLDSADLFFADWWTELKMHKVLPVLISGFTISEEAWSGIRWRCTCLGPRWSCPGFKAMQAATPNCGPLPCHHPRQQNESWPWDIPLNGGSTCKLFYFLNYILFFSVICIT